MRRTNSLKALKLIVILASSTAFISGCSVLLSSSGPLPVTYAEDTLVLAWDADHESIEGSASATVSYKIYYRELGTLTWIYLQSTPDDRATATIQRIGNGSYEFAVQSVLGNGKTSERHGSSDFSASPPGGWYLKWE